MAVPVIHGVAPITGPASGGDLVRLTGEQFGVAVEVRFGTQTAVVETLREEDGLSIADVRSPVHDPGTVDLTLTNLDEAGLPVPGESVTLPGAFRFLRPRLVRESDLTRLVRTLIQQLKRQVLANTSVTVSVDYDDTTADGLNVVAMAALPSLVLSGPRMRESRFYSTNVPFEDVVDGVSGPELRRRRPVFTVDLSFTITAASESTVELLNLMAAVATFLNRNRDIAMLRDPDQPELGEVQWEMEPDGDFRTNLRDQAGVRAFTCGFSVRGFDVDEGLPMDLGKAVVEAQLETTIHEEAPA